jgi:hypothetical protein
MEENSQSGAKYANTLIVEYFSFIARRVLTPLAYRRFMFLDSPLTQQLASKSAQTPSQSNP